MLEQLKHFGFIESGQEQTVARGVGISVMKLSIEKVRGSAPPVLDAVLGP
jgi:hypothetical protein